MLRAVVVVLVALLLGLLAWVALQTSEVSIIVNGEKLTGPARLAAEGWGILVAMVVLFSAAILLVFVFAGAGLIVLGGIVLAGFLGLWILFPFLLPVLLPLLVVWLVVAAVRGSRKAAT